MSGAAKIRQILLTVLFQAVFQISSFAATVQATAEPAEVAKAVAHWSAWLRTQYSEEMAWLASGQGKPTIAEVDWSRDVWGQWLSAGNPDTTVSAEDAFVYLDVDENAEMSHAEFKTGYEVGADGQTPPLTLVRESTASAKKPFISQDEIISCMRAWSASLQLQYSAEFAWQAATEGLDQITPEHWDSTLWKQWKAPDGLKKVVGEDAFDFLDIDMDNFISHDEFIAGYNTYTRPPAPIPLADVTSRPPNQDSNRSSSTAKLANSSVSSLTNRSNASPRRSEHQGVRLKFTVHNLDYGALTDNTTLQEHFELATRREIAFGVGHNCKPSDVLLTLSAGSIDVHARVLPPAGSSNERVRSLLTENQESIADRLGSTIQALDGIERASTGSIKVEVANAPTNEAKSEVASAVSGIKVLVVTCCLAFLVAVSAGVFFCTSPLKRNPYRSLPTIDVVKEDSEITHVMPKADKTLMSPTAALTKQGHLVDKFLTESTIAPMEKINTGSTIASIPHSQVSSLHYPLDSSESMRLGQAAMSTIGPPTSSLSRLALGEPAGLIVPPPMAWPTLPPLSAALSHNPVVTDSALTLVGDGTRTSQMTSAISTSMDLAGQPDADENSVGEGTWHYHMRPVFRPITANDFPAAGREALGSAGTTCSQIGLAPVGLQPVDLKPVCFNPLQTSSGQSMNWQPAVASAPGSVAFPPRYNGVLPGTSTSADAYPTARSPGTDLTALLNSEFEALRRSYAGII